MDMYNKRKLPMTSQKVTWCLFNGVGAEIVKSATDIVYLSGLYSSTTAVNRDGI